MNNNEITTITHKRYSDSKFKNTTNSKKYLKKLLTRIFISLIVIIVSAIFVKIDSRNKLYIKEYVFTDNIKFTEINKWYQERLGKIIPKTKPSDELVFSSNDLKNSKYEKYLDGIKIYNNKGNPISSLYGGIVVFIGNKDNYGNTLIVQGNDGIDYWYGNITNINVNLYDYIEKDTIIGEASDDYVYLVLDKNGNFIEYDEYIK